VFDEDGNPVSVAATGDAGPQSSSRSSTRNFQNDRTINHVRQSPASVERLSVSVVIDHRRTIDEAGAVSFVARTPEELAEFGSLVRSAVGFDELRGDSLTISNQSFIRPELPDAMPSAPIWQQPWVPDLGRYLASGLGILLLMMLVVRPVLKSLASAPMPMLAVADGGSYQSVVQGPGGQAAIPMGQRSLDGSPLGRARKAAEEDPRLVAHVVRQWMSTDAN
jgi:flagellar M-ring protein FliF